jgi:hypothetical protein
MYLRKLHSTTSSESRSGVRSESRRFRLAELCTAIASECMKDFPEASSVLTPSR